MTLRIKKPSRPDKRGYDEGLAEPAEASEGDDWSERVAKLIPAEALGFYGTAVGMVATWEEGSFAPLPTLIGITLVACAITVIVRYRSTSGPGGPQVIAIGISLISFLIWLAALATTGGTLSPFPREWVAPYAPLLALGWGTLVPYFYRGD